MLSSANPISAFPAPKDGSPALSRNGSPLLCSTSTPLSSSPDDDIFFRSRANDPTSYFCIRSPPIRRTTMDSQSHFSIFFSSRINDPTSFFFRWTKEAAARAMSTSAEFDAPGCKKSVSEAWARSQLAIADCVCFDVDSTVCVGEGIDDLAEHCGVGEDVKRWTNAAMGGQMKFEIALAARLDIMKPTRTDFLHCAENPVLTPNIKNLVYALHARGTDVYLVSGGFRLMIEPVAKLLNIDPINNVFANTVFFDEEERYTHFDDTEPTSHDGGKADALRVIIEKKNYKSVVMIGDGVTDLQARPPAKAVIGFGGNIIRPSVQEGADWFVTEFEKLTNVVNSGFARRLSQEKTPKLSERGNEMP